MNKNFEKVKSYYKKELWNIERVKMAVVKKWITEEEYEEIAGEKYTA